MKKEDIIIEKFIYDNRKSTLNINVKIDKYKDGMEMAYYLYSNDKKILSRWYEPCEEKNSISIDIYETSAYLVKIFIRYENEIVLNNTNKLIIDFKNGVSKNAFHAEKVFKMDIPIRYIFQEVDESDKLMVIFSGASKREYEGGEPMYNYVKKLSDLKMNKLFILDDYNGKFCFYIGNGGKNDMEAAVVALINKISSKLNVTSKNTYSMGTSKGGSAALYYGLKYNFGKIYSGAPQYFITDEVRDIGENNKHFYNIYQTMINGSDSLANHNKFNGLLKEAINDNDIEPEILLHVGNGDYHYKKHLIPLMKALEKKGIKYNLDIKEYSNHGDVGIYFPGIVIEELSS